MVRNSAGLTVTTAEAAERIEFMGSSMRRLVTAPQTDGAWALVRSHEQPGQGSGGLHRHHGEPELFYVLDGGYQFKGLAGTFPGSPGDIVFVPPDVAHDFVAGPEGGTCLCLLPGCFDGFFTSALAALQRGAAGEAAMPEIMERHCLQGGDVDDESRPLQLAPRLISATDGEDVWFQGWLVSVKLDGDDTHGALSLFDCRAAMGPATPRHQDAKHQAFVLLEGQMTFWTDTGSVEVASGTALVVSPGTTFAYRVDSETAHLLIVASPSGLEQFFRDGGPAARNRSLPAGGPPHQSPG